MLCRSYRNQVVYRIHAQEVLADLLNLAQFVDSLSIFDMDLLDTELCQRVAYIDAMTNGISVMQYAPSSKAANEIESLCDELTLQETEEESITPEPYSYAEPHNVYGDKPSW